jgi:hypothetical protein
VIGQRRSQERLLLVECFHGAATPPGGMRTMVRLRATVGTGGLVPVWESVGIQRFTRGFKGKRTGKLVNGREGVLDTNASDCLSCVQIL